MLKSKPWTSWAFAATILTWVANLPNINATAENFVIFDKGFNQSSHPQENTTNFELNPSRTLDIVDKSLRLFDDDKINLLGFNEPIGAYHLSGEYDESRLTFEYNAKISGPTAELILVYRNAVSVMPEASRLIIEVNKKQVGDIMIKAPAGSQPQSFKLPAHLLKDGTNEVVLKAHQRHRVDCSFGATYELWTQIDPNLSGIRPQNEQAITEFSQLKTIQRSDNGLTNINLVLPSLNETDGKADLKSLNEALAFLQTIALVLGREDISISVSQRPGIGPGIDLFVSTLSAKSPLYEQQGFHQTTGPIKITSSASGDRAQITLNAATQSQLVKALLLAVKGPLKPYIQNTISHESHGEIHAQEGETYKLSDAGFTSTSFSGRLFRTDFTLNLPSDFYPADYASIDLGLNAATSPGLNVQSQLLVRVNGSIVKSLPMRDRDGQVFENTRIELPLRAFRAGKNQVEILAEVGRASDHDCLYQNRDETTPRFILLDNTEIRVPHLARVSRLPELSTFAETAYPYADEQALDVHVLEADQYSLSAALTLLNRLSLAAKAPLKANLVIGAPAPHANTNHKLVIAPQNATQLNQMVFHLPTNRHLTDTDGADRFEGHDNLTTASTKMVVNRHLAEGSPDDLLAHFKHMTKPDTADLSWMGRVRHYYEDGMNQLKSWLSYQPYNESANTELVDTRQARLTQNINHDTGAVETWLIAANSIDAMDAANLLARPSIWDNVHGADIALLLDKNSIEVSSEPVAQSFQFTDRTPGNLRRVLAAWLSDHFLTYVTIVLMTISLFGFFTARIIPHLGVKNEQ